MVLSIILLAGFIMTRLTDTLNLLRVSGYVLAGVLIGPCCLDSIPMPIVMYMDFVSDLALAFITFGVGKFLRREVLLHTGEQILVITLFETLFAGAVMTLSLRLIFSPDWDFALAPGVIVTAATPISTMMIINQYEAKGESVDALLQIVTLDDVVCLLTFSAISAIASGQTSSGVSAENIIIPLAFDLLAILLGFSCGYFLSRLLMPSRSRGSRLTLAIAMLLGISGICTAADISPFLSCIVFGTAYTNLTKDKKLFRQINNFTPPVISIFLIVSGVNLSVCALSTVGVTGLSYFIVCIMGKYIDTYVSCLIANTSMETCSLMGLALIPQAGVAIGLTLLDQRLLPPETGNLMLIIILSSSVLYEMIEPISAELTLIFPGSILSGKLLETLSQKGGANENSDAVTILSLILASELSQKGGESSAQIVEELNAGIDERDDDDTESATPLEEQKEEKEESKKKHKKKREKIVEIPLEEDVWAEGRK